MDQQFEASVLGFPLPSQLVEVVNELWPVGSRWQPHITLAYPPFIPKEEWPRLRPLIVECLASFPPFEITLSELDQFVGQENVLWLKPEDAGVVARIRAALEQRLPRYVSPLPYSFIPHVTLEVFDDLEKLALARESLSRVWRPFTCCLEEVYYVVRKPESDWYLHDRLQLSGK